MNEAGCTGRLAALGLQGMRHRRGAGSPGRRSLWGNTGARWTLTFVGAEAVFAILFKVIGGGAPEEAVAAACVRAAVVFLAVEEEGELAELPVGVPVLHTDH